MIKQDLIELNKVKELHKIKLCCKMKRKFTDDLMSSKIFTVRARLGTRRDVKANNH